MLAKLLQHDGKAGAQETTFSLASYGTSLVDFGAGALDAQTIITGQAGILATSFVEAHLIAVATVDHSSDEHVVEDLAIKAGNIVPGVGFTIYANVGNVGVSGKWSVAWSWS